MDDMCDEYDITAEEASERLGEWFQNTAYKYGIRYTEDKIQAKITELKMKGYIFKSMDHAKARAVLELSIEDTKKEITE